MPGLHDRIELATGRRPTAVRSAGSGAAGTIVRVSFEDGSTLIVKQARHDEADLTVEARALALLARRSSLPIPRVIAAEPDLLILENMPGSPGGLHTAEEDAARLIAELHGVLSPDGTYGLDHDGFIGPLPQRNTPSASWVEFFRERRLLAMTRAAAEEAALPLGLAARLERLAGRLGEMIPDAPPPSLIHGDIWSGNVLAVPGRVTAFLDPAPYYAHAEVELAFITLFSTFGPAFLERYHHIRGTGSGDRAEFQRCRRPLYNLYPLLVHVRLYGSGYLGDLQSSLAILGV